MHKITKILIMEVCIVHTILIVLWVREDLFFSYPLYLQLINGFTMVAIAAIASYKRNREVK